MIQSIVDKFSNPKVSPTCLKFSAKENSDGNLTAMVLVEGQTAVNGGCRIVDPWTVAFIDELNKCQSNVAVQYLRIELENSPRACDLESFRRRLSYLALNNEWSVELFISGARESLYDTWKSLLERRPQNEIINRDVMVARKDSDDTDGKLEKNFQTWLAGEKRSSNERLCILGKDFIFDKKSKQNVLREFPTGAYGEVKNKENRILPTYWLDFVTVNNKNEIALIELKVNDNKLNVLAQLLDYALFFDIYATELSEILSEHLDISVNSNSPIACYLVNTKFHPRFDTIAPYFAPHSDEVRFYFRKVLLGSMTDISAKKSP